MKIIKMLEGKEECMKQNYNFRIVLLGQIISLFGSAIQRFSLSLYLLELTGSASIYGNILAISILPYIFLAPIAGELADRMSKKKIMVVLDGICFGLLLVYGIYLGSGGESVVIAGGVMLLLSTAAALYAPAVTSCLPQIVEKDRLKFANSCVSQVGAWANIIGPVVAGILYGFFGIKFIVFANAISFFISAIMECFLVIPFQKSETSYRLSFVSSYIEMGKTWKVLRKEYIVVFGIILSYGLFNICIGPVNTIVLPYVLNLIFGVSSEVYGMVEGIITLGMLVSGMLLAVRAKWFPFRQVYRWNYPMCIALIIMTIAVTLWHQSFGGVAAFALGGMVIMFCLGVGNIVTLTYIQEKVPEHMLGKVSALSTAVATATVPVGQILFGNILEWVHVGVLLFISAILNGMVSLFVRRNVKMEDK